MRRWWIKYADSVKSAAGYQTNAFLTAMQKCRQKGIDDNNQTTTKASRTTSNSIQMAANSFQTQTTDFLLIQRLGVSQTQDDHNHHHQVNPSSSSSPTPTQLKSRQRYKSKAVTKMSKIKMKRSHSTTTSRHNNKTTQKTKTNDRGQSLIAATKCLTLTLSAVLFVARLLIATTLIPTTQLARGQIVAEPTDSFVRLCVTANDFGECMQMSSALNGTLTCVKGRDKYDCMRSIIEEQADIVNLNSEELYLAGRLYNLEPFAMEQYNGDTQHFKSVVVINSKAQINKIADLRGKRSCHGTLNSTYGWDVPIGLLLATLTMQPDCRGELQTASKFFEQSCAPEKLYPNLCASCQNATLCSASDEFYGDDGALKCLFQNYGHVAFTNHQSVQRFLSVNRLDARILANFEYLCLDGLRRPLDSTPCEWAHKPTNVFVTGPSRRRHKELYLNFLQHVFLRFVPYKPSWWRMASFLSDSTHITQIVGVPRHLQHWDKYLGNYISSIEKPLPGCEPNNVTFCAHNLHEELKCLDLQKAAFSQRIRPQIECKRQRSAQDCVELVAKRKADVVSVDISELYETNVELVAQLEPVAFALQARPDYAVAVVRADSDIKFLYELGGRRSCHAYQGHTASWLAPLAVLSERSLLDARSCNKADQMAEYFGGSCVPGAADLRVNRFRSGFERLCNLCRGDTSASEDIFSANTNNNIINNNLHHCERSPSERYFGETGALRCLVEGASEVSFMSASALLRNVDGRSKLDWARSMPLALDSRNFRLICRNGPSMSAADFQLCHLTALPGKVVVSSKFAADEDRVTLRQLLVELVDKFALNAESATMFDLFTPYQNETNLLFDDNTLRLVPLPLEMSNFDTLVRQHFDPSLAQLPPVHRPTGCKLVLSSGNFSLHHKHIKLHYLLVACSVFFTTMFRQKQQQL